MRNPDRETVFRFKQFAVVNRLSAMKVGTDGVLLGAWAAGDGEDFHPWRILDVGCGTGLIALMMAQRFVDADIFAIEIDPVSAQEAGANFAASPWADRLHLLEGDFNRCELPGLFDLIVSNPPFFTNGLTAPDVSRMQARHEATLTLQTLVNRSAGLLSHHGRLALVLPADRLPELQPSETGTLSISRLCEVSTVPMKPPRRILAEFCLGASEIDRCPLSQLSIHDSAGNFTPEYVDLTHDFYLKF